MLAAGGHLYMGMPNFVANSIAIVVRGHGHNGNASGAIAHERRRWPE